MPTQNDEAMAAVNRSIALVRALNKAKPSRSKALALTKCEEALHWLWADTVSVPKNEENARGR